VSDPRPSPEDATRRTYLAQERTLLAWWRSGLAAFAVAVAIGRLTPAVLHVDASPYVTLGVGFGIVGLAFVFLGARRDRAVIRQLAAGRFEPLDARIVWALTTSLLILGAVTIALLVLGR
jgi:putative membrane protein